MGTFWTWPIICSVDVMASSTITLTARALVVVVVGGNIYTLSYGYM